MFSVSGIDVQVNVLIPGGAAHIDRYTTGSRHELQIENWFTVPVDVEVDCNLSAGLLVFASGSTWHRPISGIPMCTAPGSGFRVHEPISKPHTTPSGSEGVSCRRLRYRFSGAAGWNPHHHPAGGNTVIVTVR